MSSVLSQWEIVERLAFSLVTVGCELLCTRDVDRDQGVRLTESNEDVVMMRRRWPIPG